MVTLIRRVQILHWTTSSLSAVSKLTLVTPVTTSSERTGRLCAETGRSVRCWDPEYIGLAYDNTLLHVD